MKPDFPGCKVEPGFVDAHCHIIPTGLDLQRLHLGTCTSRDDVLQRLTEWHAENPEGWLHAVHYDQTKFADTRHLTRHDIDGVLPDRPVLLRHTSGHASVANTAALVAAQVDDTVEDPTGGTFERDAGGHLTGVLLERAHETVTANAPAPSHQDLVDAVHRAAAQMAEVGITCATDMMTGRWGLERELAAYREAAEGGCKVRLRLFAQWGTVLGPRGVGSARVAELTSGLDPAWCRLEGLKIFADGAVGAATAAIYGAYLTTGGSGQLIYEPERFKEMVLAADEAGFRLAVHTIGDRATDLVMEAYESTKDPRRHRIEHAMILSDAQIERLARLGSHVTMQPEFLPRFGHAYQKQLGPDRASKIKRFKSVLEAGIPLSFSSDRPIVPGDPLDGIRCSVDRPEGFDPGENISAELARQLYTLGSARANGDELPDNDFQVIDDQGLLATYCGGTLTYQRT